MDTLFDFETFPILATQRLILREIVHKDAEAIFQIRGDEEVTRYNSGMPFVSLGQAYELIESMSYCFQQKREIRWGITLRGIDKVIGMCGYNYWTRRDSRGSIGYDLARLYWGRGIMPEAIHEIILFGFRHMNLNRIEADVSAENTASQRVLEKVGFQYEGTQREQYFDYGVYHDLKLYSLLKQEYHHR